MKRIEINVSGPTQSSKSIILPDDPEPWERDMLKDSYIVLTETNIPRQ